jgi:hypothetical protein
MTRVVNRVLTKKSELKYIVAGSEDASLYHNRGTVAAGALTTNQGASVFNPWAFIAQGTTSSQRVGSEIMPRGMSVRLHYVPSEDRMTQHLRVIVCTIPKVSNAVVSDGSNFNLFDAGVSNNTLCSFRKDDNNIKIMYDKVFSMRAVPFGTTTTGVSRFFKKFFIRRKRSSKIIYERTNEIINKPLAIYVIPYDRYPAVRTDVLGRLDLFYKLYFRDI